MKHSIFLMASMLLLAGCSKEESGANDSGNGEKYVLDFTSNGQAPQTRAAGNLTANSNASVSVFSGATGNGASTFLDSPYMVTGDKLTYRNDLKLTGKQAIISVSPGTWSTYASAVNDGDYRLTLTKNATESASTYATVNGYEYIFAKAENKPVTAAAASRSISMTFNRQVAKVVFTVVAGSGLNALPAVCTENQKVEVPKMQLPVRGTDATEGLLEVTKGITKPLTKVGSALENIYANAVGEAFGFSYYLLPLSTGSTATTFDVQFQLKVAETGGALGALRTFDVKNVILPTRTDGTYGFDMGKQYNYTVTVTNTGLYLSDVNVVDWAISDQGNLPAQ